MKKCNRFHIQDVESGDILHFDGRNVRTTVDGPLETPQQFDAKVYKPFHTHNFGWVIVTHEPIGADEVDHFYLQDDWIISHKEA